MQLLMHGHRSARCAAVWRGARGVREHGSGSAELPPITRRAGVPRVQDAVCMLTRRVHTSTALRDGCKMAARCVRRSRELGRAMGVRTAAQKLRTLSACTRPALAPSAAARRGPPRSAAPHAREVAEVDEGIGEVGCEN